MSINQVEDIFTKSRIDFQKTDISHIPWLILLPDDVKNYLECMGKTLKWHETQYGSAWTTLYGVNELMDYQETVCHENNLLVIGNGLNGDLLTINLKNNHIGYVFHDDLWEGNYSTLEDIYCELPFGIDIFLKMVMETESYPIDGTMAEEMKMRLSQL